ncbi:MAG TPA: proteasome subunit beta [Streptosporangiaceae bacterium]|nr:proteasome subunit beta [Streptosporangiaceae bacterium]
MGFDTADGGQHYLPYTRTATSSFTEFLRSQSPGLLPGWLPGEQGIASVSRLREQVPHGTTIVAVTCADGVVIAGDRRATVGNMIAKRDAEKVFKCDEFSAVGIAGTFSLALAMVRIFQVELEHYEKMEGRSLSLSGKANRLGGMVRGNLGMAMQGFAAIPLFVGYDEASGTGRIFSYDGSGGPHEERRYHSIGSGSPFARGSLKKLYTDDLPASEAVLACVQALYDAADDDSATGGPDLGREIFPIVATVTADGFRQLPEAEAADYARRITQERLTSPDGPRAILGQSRDG